MTESVKHGEERVLDIIYSKINHAKASILRSQSIVDNCTEGLEGTSLRGNWFKETYEKGFERICGNCYHGVEVKHAEEYVRTCNIDPAPDHPLRLFQIDGSIMPDTIGNIEVGNYCPKWAPLDTP